MLNYNYIYNMKNVENEKILKELKLQKDRSTTKLVTYV
jgi:hypothetical protein